MVTRDLRSAVAFVGYSAWRREENSDANLFDTQVLVIRASHIRFLNPRCELENFSPDGLAWGYRGSSCATRYAVSQVIGFIKGKSAIHLARVYGERKRNFVGQHFWARGIGYPPWAGTKLRFASTSRSKKRKTSAWIR